MMDKYFEDEPPASDQGPPAEKESGDDQTFVLPKSIADVSVGDTLTLKIVADHEDSYEVQLAGESEPTQQPEAESESPISGKMDSYME